MKVLVGAFNQEKALVGAFSVIVKTDCGTDGSFYSTTPGTLLENRVPVDPAGLLGASHGPQGDEELPQIIQSKNEEFDI